MRSRFRNRDWMEPDGSEIPLSKLAKEVGVHYSTVLAWAKVGRQGIKLRVCQHTSGLASSLQEYDSFLKRLNEIA